MKSIIKTIKYKIQKKRLTVGIVGLGYVGLPLALRVSEFFKTVGYDNDKNKIKTLYKSKSYLLNANSEILNKNLKKSLYPTSSIKKLAEADIIIICLPTPLKNKNIPDLSFIKKFIKKLKPMLLENKIIILESTSYPGTTNEIITNELNDKFTIGESLFIGYSPEREDPGNKRYNLVNTPKLVSGSTLTCLNLVNSFYRKIKVNTVKVQSIEVAESAKLIENIYRSVNIALVNEMKIIFDKMGIDIYKVIEAAKTKPFGFKAFYPGPGTGGHCIPIDPLYLSWKAKQFGLNSDFISLASKTNLKIPGQIIKTTIKKLRQTQKKKIYKFLLIGASYKKNINDCREAAIFKFVTILKRMKHNVSYHDEFIKSLPKTREYKFNLKSINLSKKNLRKYDAVILLVDHDYINFKDLKKFSNLLVDCRGKFNRNNKNII